MLYHAALVLEGGAMRGQYSTGITDAFLKHHLEFESVIGVSAGALCGAQFVSKQYGRMVHVNTTYRHNADYISMRRLLKKKEVLNLDFLFEDHGWDWHNFDERAYERSASHFTIVATELTSGKAVTFTDPTGKELEVDLKASSSMPFFTAPPKTTAGECLDGGLANSIPFNIAQDQGFDKIVVVRTRPSDYRKKPTGKVLKEMFEHKFKDYPKFVETAIKRPEMYNQQVKSLNRLVSQHQAYVFNPNNTIKVGRLENNTKKIQKLYQQGMEQAEAELPALMAYLNE
ncbi:patatin family protein [Lactobacillus alvi]|uniref:Patatin family protein n=1 Tax=Limosilactobacillus alvi TaxID=990412 RepID=A0ABS2EQ50_9LACO|nr:patatin family protein [Limosilactobacillus alvi]MBM6754634.1 patatin family protein [Limosilactobacillus alvi]